MQENAQKYEADQYHAVKQSRECAVAAHTPLKRRPDQNQGETRVNPDVYAPNSSKRHRAHHAAPRLMGEPPTGYIPNVRSRRTSALSVTLVVHAGKPDNTV